MKNLSYSQLQQLQEPGYFLPAAPEKVMQFGEGNFLRSFVEYWFDLANERAGWNGKIVLVQPRGGGDAQGFDRKLNAQDGLYTLYLRGMENGQLIDRKRIISCVSRCISPRTEEGFQSLMELAESDDLEYVVSNTTEAGIIYDPACLLEDRPCTSFPGKLTQVLYARYRAGKGGLILLPCELIDNNGQELRRCVNCYISQWGLEEGFRRYVNETCTFCSTLVDRIVPGRIRNEEERIRLEKKNGYADPLAVVGEVFGVWMIEGPEWLAEKLPFRAADLNCHIVPTVVPYKKRKVRILNGAHTGFTLGAYLAGFNIVRDCMHNDVIRNYMNKMLCEEVLPTLRKELNEADLKEFVHSVQERFENPFIDHELLSISLNSTSKWKARNLPSLLEYVDLTRHLPQCLTMSFAAYIAFFTSDIQELNDQGLVCRRPDGSCYLCRDDREILKFYHSHRLDREDQLVHAVMSSEKFWGRNLTAVPDFEEMVVRDLKLIRRDGALAAFAACL